MKLEGIHHITAITGDAPRNVEFYAGALGPADGEEDGQPGRPDRLPPLLRRREGLPRRRPHVLRVPGRDPGPRGRRHGPSHRVAGRLRRGARLLGDAPGRRGRRLRARRGRLRFARSRGARARAASSWTGDAPLIAAHPDVPAEHALQGFDAVHAYAPTRPAASAAARGAGLRAPATAATARSAATCAAALRLDEPPAERAVPGAGTVHHVAWATRLEDQEAWQAPSRGRRRPPDPDHRPLLLPLGLLPRAQRRALRARDDGPRVRSDEDPDHLGERLSLPPNFEHLRDQVEKLLTPLPNPRASASPR